LKTFQIKNSRYHAKFRVPDPWRVSDYGTLPIESSSFILLDLGFTSMESHITPQDWNQTTVMEMNLSLLTVVL
jgi:hypothetical protein